MRERVMRAVGGTAAAAPQAAPVAPPEPPPVAWLEQPDGSLVRHDSRGDGRRVMIAGAVYDICGTLAGVPVFRFIHQEPL